MKLSGPTSAPFRTKALWNKANQCLKATKSTPKPTLCSKRESTLLTTPVWLAEPFRRAITSNLGLMLALMWKLSHGTQMATDASMTATKMGCLTRRMNALGMTTLSIPMTTGSSMAVMLLLTLMKTGSRMQTMHASGTMMRWISMKMARLMGAIR